MTRLLITLPIILIILSILNALQKTEKNSKIETIIKIISVYATITTFAWVINFEQYNILHTITQQTIIENEGSEMTAEYFKENILNTLPNQTWQGISKITLKSHIQTTEENDLLYETYGIYHPYTNEIQLKVIQINEMKRNTAHELAHYYWFNKLTKKQRKEWKKLHENTRKFSSEYAKTNEEEDFAETISYIIAYKSVTTDQEKIDFIIENYIKPLNLKYNITKQQQNQNFYIVSTDGI